LYQSLLLMTDEDSCALSHQLLIWTSSARQLARHLDLQIELPFVSQDLCSHAERCPWLDFLVGLPVGAMIQDLQDIGPAKGATASLDSRGKCLLLSSQRMCTSTSDMGPLRTVGITFSHWPKIQNTALAPGSQHPSAHLEEQVGKDKHTKRNRNDRRQRHSHVHDMLHRRLRLRCHGIRLFSRRARRPLPQPDSLRWILQLSLEPLDFLLSCGQGILIV
jgi:hypothetical protein